MSRDAKKHPPRAAVDEAMRAYDLELEALAEARDRVIEDLPEALALLATCQGKILVSGLGKSGHVGRKVAATLSSLGRPAAFVHATEALHGDSGTFAAGDVAVLISNSGRTVEVVALAQMLNDWGIPYVAMTQRVDSPLARGAQAVVRVAVPAEADPHNLAPTSSSTLTLVIGDAMAVGLMSQQEFTPEDFAVRHPGGALGHRLAQGADSDALHAEGVAR